MDPALAAERAQAERLAKLGQVPPPVVGAAVTFGPVTVHSASLLADLFGEPEPEPEYVAAAAAAVPLPGLRRAAGGSVSVNVDTLVAAAAAGQTELLDILVDSGARLEDTDAAGDTALIAAAKHGERACVELLLRGGADVNAPNAKGSWTPLHAAAYEQHGAVVMLLMEHGADPTVTDGEGRTPADYASLSEGVWPLFEARGCRRLTHSELVEIGVLKVSPLGPTNDGRRDGVPRPGSGNGRFVVRPPWRPVTRAGAALGAPPLGESDDARTIDVLGNAD